jgi:antitoxin (DNA-binding transcriptional repressor) of toxin-antitoxin stability system
VKTLTATEASRGFSGLLDAVERGETIAVTRGGRAIAEIHPAPRKTGRDLRLALESREHPHLTEEDAKEMLRAAGESRDLLPPFNEDPWAVDEHPLASEEEPWAGD